MSDDSVRVGVIGAGNMGTDHARQLHRWVSGASVVLVADLAIERAKEVAAEVGAGATDDPRQVIDDSAVDAVIVASHDSTHADLVRACVRAGKPVLCEKPLAVTLQEATALVTEVGADGARLISVGFMRRFDPGYGRLKTAIRSGDLGTPLMLHCTGRGVTSGPGTTSESSITNSAIHDLDIVPWLLDAPAIEVAWVAPRQSGLADGFQDPQILLLRTADGVLSTVETYLNARYGYDVRCEAVCETGAASLAEPAMLVTDSALRRSVAYAKDWRPRFAEAYRLELSAWVASVALGRPPIEPMATAGDGLAAAAVAEAAVTSMRGGGGFARVPGVPNQ